MKTKIFLVIFIIGISVSLAFAQTVKVRECPKVLNTNLVDPPEVAADKNGEITFTVEGNVSGDFNSKPFSPPLCYVWKDRNGKEYISPTLVITKKGKNNQKGGKAKIFIDNRLTMDDHMRLLV